MNDKKLDRKMMSEMEKYWNGEGIHALRTKEVLWCIQFGKCFYCLCELDQSNWSIDHILPKCKGGDNNFRNKVLACCCCNNLKSGNKVNEEWVTERLEYFNLGAKEELFRDIN